MLGSMFRSMSSSGPTAGDGAVSITAYHGSLRSLGGSSGPSAGAMGARNGSSSSSAGDAVTSAPGAFRAQPSVGDGAEVLLSDGEESTVSESSDERSFAAAPQYSSGGNRVPILGPGSAPLAISSSPSGSEMTTSTSITAVPTSGFGAPSSLWRRPPVWTVGPYTPALPLSGALITAPSALSGAPAALTQQRANVEAVDEPTAHLLVLGSPQCGKSTFINAYRASVCPTDDWPLAPTGMCGVFGTVSVAPCPRSSVPTRGKQPWDLVDTPGRVYTNLQSPDSNDSMLLQLLVEGLPWKTKLLGPGARSVSDLTSLPPTPLNKASHVIIVIGANEVIEDSGWSLQSVVGMRNRYLPGPNAGRAVEQLKWLISRVRELMNDAAPTVVVTKMDLFGSASNAAARTMLLQCLSTCIAAERIYFVGNPPTAPQLLHTTKKRIPDVDGAHDLRKLHREMMQSIRWNALLGESCCSTSATNGAEIEK